ncbi:MAG: response regulator transcription factor [Terriglobia bacterium]
MRVLIADDSKVLVERMRSRLAEVPGIEVVGHAIDVADAATKIRKARPDVVILDICMPGGSGIDVLEGLNKDKLNPIVIVLSNCHHRQYRKKCLKIGARFYFDKSAEFHKVAEVLQGLLEATVV